MLNDDCLDLFLPLKSCGIKWKACATVSARRADAAIYKLAFLARISYCTQAFECVQVNRQTSATVETCVLVRLARIESTLAARSAVAKRARTKVLICLI
jgi:hypothetical protein